jgi:hypothetical protein
MALVLRMGGSLQVTKSYKASPPLKNWKYRGFERASGMLRNTK